MSDLVISTSTGGGNSSDHLLASRADRDQIREVSEARLAISASSHRVNVDRRDERTRVGCTGVQSGYDSGVLELLCSFCNRRQDETLKMIAGPEVYICGDCIALCGELLMSEDKAEASSVATAPSARASAPVPKPGPIVSCSFCGKPREEVKKLIAGPTVYICNECVQLCLDIIQEEQGAEAYYRSASSAILRCSFCGRDAPSAMKKDGSDPPIGICTRCTRAANKGIVGRNVGSNPPFIGVARVGTATERCCSFCGATPQRRRLVFAVSAAICTACLFVIAAKSPDP